MVYKTFFLIFGLIYGEVIICSSYNLYKGRYCRDISTHRRDQGCYYGEPKAMHGAILAYGDCNLYESDLVKAQLKTLHSKCDSLTQKCEALSAVCNENNAMLKIIMAHLKISQPGTAASSTATLTAAANTTASGAATSSSNSAANAQRKNDSKDAAK